MPRFAYKAVQGEGELTEGILEAPGRLEAMALLEQRGLRPVKIAEETGQAKPERSGFALPWKRNRVSFAQLEDFTRSLSSLLEAGVPLSRALSILSQETADPAAAKKWKEIHDLVIDGVSLAEAMARSPDVFPQVYVAMVEAGEAGGFLELVLAQIADFQARERELRSRVAAALVYPAVLLTLATGVLIFLLVFFIPRFQAMFSGFQARLPAITLAIVGASHALRDYGLYILGGIAAAVAGARQWFQSETGRRRWESFLLGLPVVGPLLAKLAMARFARMLGTLLGAGVPLIHALGVARRSLGYQTLADAVYESMERVRKGEPLAESLARCRELFSGSTLEMIRVAEESGRLDKELVRLAGTAESALDRQLKMAVALAEPALLFFIAVFIGTIFVGMVLPIFTMQDYIR